jgi:CheY-like chemotaxis protein
MNSAASSRGEGVAMEGRPPVATKPQESVLVVEDSVDLLYAIQDLLEGEGYEVFPATHGKQAIDFLTALREKRPELVVLDLMLPIMSGWDVLREMRLQRRLDTIPVLVMTASTKTKPEGAAAMIRKPFTLEAFMSAVHATSRGPEGAQP